MNSFKRSLLAITAKGMDEKITKKIEMALESLIKNIGNDVFKQQIQDRKEKIANLLVNFNTNRDIIEKNCMYYKPINENTNSITLLDKIISKTIDMQLDMLYEEVRSNSREISNVHQSHKLCVILERQSFIRELLKDFDGKMQFLQDSTKIKEEDLKTMSINEK